MTCRMLIQSAVLDVLPGAMQVVSCSQYCNRHEALLDVLGIPTIASPIKAASLSAVAHTRNLIAGRRGAQLHAALP